MLYMHVEKHIFFIRIVFFSFFYHTKGLGLSLFPGSYPQQESM